MPTSHFVVFFFLVMLFESASLRPFFLAEGTLSAAEASGVCAGRGVQRWMKRKKTKTTNNEYKIKVKKENIYT